MRCLPMGKEAHLTCHSTTPTIDEKYTWTKNM